MWVVVETFTAGSGINSIHNTTTVHGPFNNEDDAHCWAYEKEEHNPDSAYWVRKLKTP